MIVWTIQPLDIYKKLIERKILYCDSKQDGFWGLISEEFQAAYDWLTGQMRLRISLPPKGVQYPFWAWALIDGAIKKPDLRRTEFNNYSGENVVLELEIPDKKILLSDEENWHYVLNDWYLHDVNENEDKWNEADAWFDNLPTCE